MVRWFVVWKHTQHYWALPDEERMKIVEASAQKLKKDMEAGIIKDWAVKADNSGGYLIVEGTEAQLYQTVMPTSKYVSCEGTAVISLSSFLEALNKGKAAMRK